MATMAAGACPCPLEPRLGPEETQRRYRLARLGWTLLEAGQADDPSLAHVPPERRLDLDALPEAAPHWDDGLGPDDASFLLFTSGSSGKPKGVLQNHRGMWANASGVIAHTALGPADRLLVVMPLYHTNGVNNQLLAPLLAGASVHLAARFRADEMPALMARVRPTIFTGVPTMYSRMLGERFDADALAGLRLLRCGSAPITEELHRRIEAHFGRALVNSYGLSEATCTSTINPPLRRKIGSVGTPLAGQSVFLQAADGSRVDGPGREGEVCVAGPVLMSGYLVEDGDGEPQSPGEVLHSGDLGRFDEDGYLFITGRLKDVIIRGGENLSPKLIEEALVEVPGVADCCVVGRADADLGEVPVAFVVRRPGAEAVQPAALSAAVAARLSRIHQPADYRFVDALPENAVGKVDRKRLAQQLAAGG
ncbi:class I adenylate-forming enzyme family protein [Piscinibacter sakaiensis]|uniref:class I adenylate-forming enzyme family protein n=1 Tax=Piscinibacter sakaiensis TaxID=1547922 RepID=UPI00372B074C